MIITYNMEFQKNSYQRQTLQKFNYQEMQLFCSCRANQENCFFQDIYGNMMLGDSLGTIYHPCGQPHTVEADGWFLSEEPVETQLT